MQVSAIKYNTPHSLPVNKNSSQNKLSFKGYTHKIEYYAQSKTPAILKIPNMISFFTGLKILKKQDSSWTEQI